MNKVGKDVSSLLRSQSCKMRLFAIFSNTVSMTMGKYYLPVLVSTVALLVFFSLPRKPFSLSEDDIILLLSYNIEGIEKVFCFD